MEMADATDLVAHFHALHATTPLGLRCFACRTALSCNAEHYRCAGCSVALYCGKACQARAWTKEGHQHACGLLASCVGHRPGAGPGSENARAATTAPPLIGARVKDYETSDKRVRGYQLFLEELANSGRPNIVEIASDPPTESSESFVKRLRLASASLPTMAAVKIRVPADPDQVYTILSGARYFSSMAEQMWPAFNAQFRDAYYRHVTSRKRPREDELMPPSTKRARVMSDFVAEALQTPEVFELLRTLPGDIVGLVLLSRSAAAIENFQLVNRGFESSPAAHSAWKLHFERDFSHTVPYPTTQADEDLRVSDRVGRPGWRGFYDTRYTAGPALLAQVPPEQVPATTGGDAPTYDAAASTTAARTRYLRMLQLTARTMVTEVLSMLGFQVRGGHSMAFYNHMRNVQGADTTYPYGSKLEYIEYFTLLDFVIPSEMLCVDRCDVILASSEALAARRHQLDGESGVFDPHTGFGVAWRQVMSALSPPTDAMRQLFRMSSSEGILVPSQNAFLSVNNDTLLTGPSAISVQQLNVITSRRREMIEALRDLYNTHEEAHRAYSHELVLFQRSLERYVYTLMLYVDPHLELRVHLPFHNYPEYKNLSVNKVHMGRTVYADNVLLDSGTYRTLVDDGQFEQPIDESDVDYTRHPERIANGNPVPTWLDALWKQVHEDFRVFLPLEAHHYRLDRPVATDGDTTSVTARLRAALPPPPPTWTEARQLVEANPGTYHPLTPWTSKSLVVTPYCLRVGFLTQGRVACLSITNIRIHAKLKIRMNMVEWRRIKNATGYLDTDLYQKIQNRKWYARLLEEYTTWMLGSAPG